MVLRFAVDSVSAQCTQNSSCWKGTWERCRAVGTEYRRRRDQARRCHHRCRVYADLSLPFQIVGAKLPRFIARRLGRRRRQIFQTGVHLVSYPPTQTPRPSKLSRRGGYAVIVLISIRLGTSGVNPIYYETIKVC